MLTSPYHSGGPARGVMRLYLVHHGEAVPPSVDPQRPLSDTSRTTVEQLAERAAQKGATPAVVWHSGKLRARQTVEAFWRACNPLAEYAAARGLQPTDPPDTMADQLTRETRDIMLVGHMPHIERLLRLCVDGSAEGTTSFPMHGIVALEMVDSRWVPRWQLDG